MFVVVFVAVACLLVFLLPTRRQVSERSERKKESSKDYMNNPIVRHLEEQNRLGPWS